MINDVTVGSGSITTRLHYDVHRDERLARGQDQTV